VLWSRIVHGQILGGRADNNIAFRDVRSLLKHLGVCRENQGRSLHFQQGWREEILNLQAKGPKAKSYQVKQVRNLILKYQLGGQESD
jgi:hypothetical protein